MTSSSSALAPFLTPLRGTSEDPTRVLIRRLKHLGPWCYDWGGISGNEKIKWHQIGEHFRKVPQEKWTAVHWNYAVILRKKKIQCLPPDGKAPGVSDASWYRVSYQMGYPIAGINLIGTHSCQTQEEFDEVLTQLIEWIPRWPDLNFEQRVMKFLDETVIKPTFSTEQLFRIAPILLPRFPYTWKYFRPIQKRTDWLKFLELPEVSYRIKPSKHPIPTNLTCFTCHRSDEEMIQAIHPTIDTSCPRVYCLFCWPVWSSASCPSCQARIRPHTWQTREPFRWMRNYRKALESLSEIEEGEEQEETDLLITSLAI